MTEANLIKGCIEGNRQAQSALYELFAAKMFVVCLRYAQSREEAEEVLQEGFLRVFKYLHQFRDEGSFEGWVRKIMVNSALQRIRVNARLAPVLSIDGYKEQFTQQSVVESSLSSKELLQLVMSLPPAYRTVFNLYVFDGYKHREIAELLGISEGTSKSNLSDARSFLQKLLSKKKLIAK